MPTKQTITVLTKEEIKYLRRVKSVELAIKTQGRTGLSLDTLIRVSEKIYEYLNIVIL